MVHYFIMFQTTQCPQTFVEFQNLDQNQVVEPASNRFCGSILGLVDAATAPSTISSELYPITIAIS